MATTFSITMRVERKGAGGFVHNVSAENLVWAGVARAIEDIDYNMSDPAHPSYPANEMYPTTWQTLTSGSGGGVDLAWGEALDYIPGAFTTLPKAGWTSIATGGGKVAQVAYLVLNCSGFLDVNNVGGDPRSAGSSPREIQITSFPCIDPTRLAEFDAARVSDTRYEALKEFADLQTPTNRYWEYPTPDGGLFDESNPNYVPPDYFVSYSRYPKGSYNGVNVDETQVDLSGDVLALQANQAAIVAKLNAAVPGGNGQFIFDNLIDYIDVDSIPGNLGSAQTEAVPMISEVMFTPALITLERLDNASIRVSSTTLLLELCYPFARISGELFVPTLNLVTEFENVTVPGNTANMTNTLAGAAFDVATKFGAKKFAMFGFTFPQRTLSVNTNDQYKLTMKVSGTVSLSPGGQTVDATPFPTNDPPLVFDIQAFPPQLPNPPNAPFLAVGSSTNIAPPALSKETSDPRFNWNCANDFRDGPKTIGDTNAWTLFMLGRPSAAGFDRDIDMHVSDFGSLRSVGELGFLLRGAAGASLLHSIRLFNYHALQPKDDVLNHFTLSASVARGLLNLNTYDVSDNTMMTHLFRSALTNMSMQYPGSPEVLTNEVDELIDAISTWRATVRCFTNLSDIGNLPWRTLFSSAKTDLELTSMIAYSCGLLGTRQNLFTIIVEARPSSLGMGAHAAHEQTGVWSPSKRAVVQVWRDPFPTVGGQHKTFVQSFRWLTDD